MTGDHGLRGMLVSGAFAQDILPTLAGITGMPEPALRQLERWAEARASAGPATSARGIADTLVLPLLRLLGLEPLRRSESGELVRLDAAAGARPLLPVIVAPWQADLSRVWRATVLAGIGTDARWSLCSNGRALRIYDAQRTWSRAYLEFDLDVLPGSRVAQLALWHSLSREALLASPPALDRLVELSARHGADVRRALGDGVLLALRRLVGALAGAGDSNAVFEQSLTVIYRVLFLLFAEARSLVPTWHPVYRDRYTIDAIVSALLSGRGYRGAWSALQAISRLAHSGCTAGELTVTPFNGRLFSPAHAPAFDRRRLEDGVMAEAMLAVSTTTSRTGRARIRYRDLDVEQLGAIYERVLDYDPATFATDRDVRKATGTFYTPRQMTAHLVRATLSPLVQGRTADQILALRVVDPAMGSGAFLVAACRYLAGAVEDALIAEGHWHPADITADDRSALRRRVAQQCLYGVDLNPIAVQLARLSLWLATLAAGKPLTFLDHHLVTGNSLVGATLDDVARQPGGAGGRRAGARAALPLFEEGDVGATLSLAAATRTGLAATADDTAAVVRDKERTLAALHAADSPLGRWSELLDLWCSAWFAPRADRPSRALFGDLAALVVGGRASLPAAVSAPFLRRGREAAAAHRFLHWPLAFPEVFVGQGGFDAVVGNPPWDMVRGDSGDGLARAARRNAAASLTSFVRESGVYRVDARAHLNQYALFTERALHLVRPGGRIGFVLPAGLASDTGAAPLRRMLFERSAIDTLTGLDNRAGIFPIHRGVRFLLLTATAGAPTRQVTCRFGLSGLDELERSDAARRLLLTRAFLERASGKDDLGVPDLQGPDDLRILESISERIPGLADGGGWHVRFGRELNATDDRQWFTPRTHRGDERPVLEGKQVSPFRVAEERSSLALAPAAHARVPRKARLAYRDVAGAGNRLTLIAAVVPARAVTTHTLFCLKTPLALEAQHVLCALMNSLVANYLVRLRVSTHVTAALVARLRVPVVRQGSRCFDEIVALSTALARGDRPAEEMPQYIELQALVARLYGLTSADLRHILARFPLLPEGLREAILVTFGDGS